MGGKELQYRQPFMFMNFAIRWQDEIGRVESYIKRKIA
jgi:hypothetical protein